MRRWLALILLVYVATGALYAMRTPLWQAPDEPAHFNYIRNIGDTGALPILAKGDYSQDYLEKIKAAKFPPEMSVDSIRYESYQPPLYYLVATPVYLAARAGGLAIEVYALRLFSVLLGAIVIVLAFLIVRSVFPQDSLLPLASAGFVATVPMQIAITASVSNDASAELVIALLLLLAVWRIQGRVSERRFLMAGSILYGAALLTKSTSYPTGAAILLVGEVGYTIACQYPPQVRTRALRDALGRLILIAASALAISGPMFIRNILTYGIFDPLGLGRHDSIVIGQPTTAEMIAQKGWGQVITEFITVTFRSFWAQFGWMGVLVDSRLYFLFLALTAIAVFGIVVFLVRTARGRTALAREQVWMLVLLAVLIAISFVDYVGYNFKFYQLQGRYLFPAIIPIGFFFVLGWRELVAEFFPRLVFLALYGLLVGLDIACLFLYIIPQLRTV